MPSGHSSTYVRIVIDERLLNRYVVSVEDSATRKAAMKVAGRARANAPYRTGKLMNSISARKAPKSGPGLATVYLVAARGVKYALYQEWGTGPIYPVRKKFLRFIPKGGNGYVFAKKTRGVPATHFLRRAYRSLSLDDYL